MTRKPNKAQFTGLSASLFSALSNLLKRGFCKESSNHQEGLELELHSCTISALFDILRIIALELKSRGVAVEILQQGEPLSL
jgi:hypothetical protein